MTDMEDIDVVTNVFTSRSDRLQAEITAGLALVEVNVEDGRLNQKSHKNKLIQTRDSIKDKLIKYSQVLSKFGDGLKEIPPESRDNYKEHLSKYKEYMSDLCEYEQDTEDVVCKLNSMINIVSENISQGLVSKELTKKRVEFEIEKEKVELKLKADLKLEEARQKTIGLEAELEKSKTDRVAIHQELLDNGQSLPPPVVHNHYQGPSPAATVTPPTDKCSKIPKLEMPKFDSTHEGWRPWWDRFEAEIHNRTEYSEVAKFSYLKSLVSGRALLMIEHYSHTAANYRQALRDLMDKFDDPIKAGKILVNKIRSIPKCSDSLKSIDSTYSQIEAHLKALEALGRDIDNDGTLLGIILEKFPHSIGKHLYYEGLKDPSNRDTLSFVRKQISLYIKMEEYAVDNTNSDANSISEVFSNVMLTSASQPQAVQRQPMSNASGGGTQSGQIKKTPGPQGVNFSTNTGATSSEPVTRKPRCNFCKGDHYADQCTKYKTVGERLSVLDGKHCLKCLRKSHSTESCFIRITCSHCRAQRSHHRSLCTVFHPAGHMPAIVNATITEEQQVSDNSKIFREVQIHHY